MFQGVFRVFRLCFVASALCFGVCQAVFRRVPGALKHSAGPTPEQFWNTLCARGLFGGRRRWTRAPGYLCVVRVHSSACPPHGAYHTCSGVDTCSGVPACARGNSGHVCSTCGHVCACGDVEMCTRAGTRITMLVPPSNRNSDSKHFFPMQRDPEIKLANGLPIVLLHRLQRGAIEMCVGIGGSD